MNTQDIETAVADELRRIAPEIELADVDRGADLSEEFDIDSMDFLTLVTALGKRFGMNMPETEYPQMRSFDELVGYVRAQVG